MHKATTDFFSNAPGERLTCVLPVDVRRFIRVVGRRVRLVDEISDSFLTKSVDASQQSQGRYRRSSETLAPRTRPFEAQTQLQNAYSLAEDTLKESHLSVILTAMGHTILH